MRGWTLAFGLGNYLGAWIPQLPAIGPCLLFFIPFLLSLRLPGLRLGGAFSLGVGWLLVSSVTHQERILPVELEQKDLWVGGVVSGLPNETPISTRFEFITTSFCRTALLDSCDPVTGTASTRRLLLNDFGGLDISPGQHWHFKVRLKRPSGFANPGGFDYEGWLFQRRIIATGYIREAVDTAQAPGKARRAPAALFDRIRLNFRNKLAGWPLENRAFILALTIGDRYAFSDQQWSLLSSTGTNHLMVISGLHISLVAWLAYRLLLFVLRLSPWLCQLFPLSRVAAMGALLAGFGYAGLAGFSLPVQRALVMVTCLMSGMLLLRQVSPVNSLCLALLLVLGLDPLAPQGSGFWLSFLAVALLVFALLRSDEEASTQPARKLLMLLRTQLTLFIGLFPVMLLFFQQVSLLAPLVNLFAIPFIGMLVVPLCLLTLLVIVVLPERFHVLVTLPDFLLSLFSSGMMQLVSRLDWLQVQFPALPAAWLGLLIASVLVQIIYCRFYGMLACLLLSALALLYRPERPATGQFILDILDVGQGLATVITTRNHLLVYDTGPAFGPRFDAGDGIIVPFLRQGSLGRADRIIVSHGDNDHAGGLGALRNHYPGSEVISGEALNAPGPARRCQGGDAWTWDAVHFRILYPASSDATGNNASCVLEISTGSYRVLLPGDIEQQAELSLARQYLGDLKANILLAPHHGSSTSSTPLLVRLVAPDYVVFTTGYLNPFNHPHPDVVARYRRQGAQLLDTANTGHIRFSVSPEIGISAPVNYRETRSRFWTRQ